MSSQIEETAKPAKPAAKTSATVVKTVPIGLIASLPCLFPGRDNNYFIFQKDMHIYCIMTYGGIGKIFIANAYPTITKPQMPAALAGVETRNNFTIEKEIAAAEYKEDLQIYHRKVAEFEKNKLPLFGCIMGQLSDASRDKLAKEATWSAVLSEYDPLALWKLITKTHLVHNSGVTASDKAHERAAYGTLRMLPTETLSAFAMRFENALKRMEAVGIAAISEADKAGDFVNKLHDRYYGRMRQALMENEIQGIGNYPSTFDEAYTMAQRWSETDPYDELPIIKDNTEAADGGSVFFTDGDDAKGKKNGNRGGQRGTRAGDTSTDKTDKTDKKTFNPCYVCEEKHRVKDCPYLDEFSDWVKIMKKDKAQQQKKKRDAAEEHAKVTIAEEDDIDEDDADLEFYENYKW